MNGLRYAPHRLMQRKDFRGAEAKLQI